MTRDRWKTAVTLLATLALALSVAAEVALAQPPAAAGSKRMPRAYEGAPPLVPHDVEARKVLCQECHATGAEGAPITPHPTRTHFCIACHVPQDLSVKAFEKAKP